MTRGGDGGDAAAWRWLYGELKPHRRALFVVFVAGAAPVLLNLPALWLMQFTFDVAIPAGLSWQIVGAVAAMACCRLAFGYLAYRAALATAMQLRKITAGLRMSMMARLHALRWTDLAGLDSAVTQGRLVIDTERVEGATHAIFNAAAPALVPIVVFTAVMLWLSWPMTVALALVAPLLHVPLFSLSGHVRDKTAAFQAAFERFNSGAGRLVRMLPVSRLQGTESHALTGFRASVDDVAIAGAGMVGAHSLFAQSNSAVIVVATAIILAGGGVAVANGALSMGALAAFTMAASIAGGAASRLAGAMPSLLTGRESLLRLSQALANATTDNDVVGAAAPNHAGALTLRGVTVRLGGRTILRDLFLDVVPGRVTAVAAPNGQGKSTLVAVLLGLVVPEMGVAALDGAPLSEFNPTAYRAGVGVVPQSPVFVKGTFRENICFGRPHVPDAALQRALDLSGAGEMLGRLGATLDTPMGEEGRTVSGGEAQRVAIARALAHDPRILFLDEPTNHLDDAAVDQLIARLIRPGPDGVRRTIVAVTHDSRILAAAHMVYDLTDGAAVLRSAPLSKAVS